MKFSKNVASDRGFNGLIPDDGNHEKTLGLEKVSSSKLATKKEGSAYKKNNIPALNLSKIELGCKAA